VNDFYCSQKFWWLTLDVERRSVASCCAATPEKVNLEWLRNNPGQSFNIPELVSDRQAMLNGQPVPSCEENCWRPERAGLVSRRMTMATNLKTHTDVQAKPTTLHIVLGTDCNLTCTYCCKQYSTAWLRDIVNNGSYIDETRQTINSNDQIVIRLGQKAIQSSSVYQLMVDELAQFKGLTQIEITGGEPFLYNNLPDLVSKMSGPVDIFTGLGVDTNRLKRILDQLPSTVTFTVSAENTGKLYEFNRYGNTWDRFRTNLDIISKSFKYRFCNVVSNLTIHDLEKFRSEFSTSKDLTNFCNDPDYLGVNVLDATSKTKYKINDNITKMLETECTPDQKQKFQTYIKEFARRRGLEFDIFPDHFVAWFNERN
jgi:organic radical activating enzyme